jgi:hypothetical protein
MKINLDIVNDVTYKYAKFYYSLRLIVLFANMNVSRHILVLDTSILAKSNMGRREYKILCIVTCELHKNNKI